MIKYRDIMKNLETLEQEMTFAQIFRLQEKFKNKVAFETIKDNKMIKMTYKEYTRTAIKKGYIIKRELKNIPFDSYVVLKLSNSIEWCINYWAIILAGYNPVLVDAKFSLEDVNYAIAQTNAQAIITDDSFTYSVMKLTADASEGEEYDYNNDSMGSKVVFCTSGTSERFKLFEYNEEAICHQILDAKDIIDQNFGLSQGNKPCAIKNLAFLPFHHIFGYVAVFIWYTVFSATIVFPEYSTPECILYTCQKHRVTHVYAVPVLWNFVAKNLKQKAVNGTELEKKYINKALKEGYDLQIPHLPHSLKKTQFCARFVQKSLFGNKIQYMISGGGYIPEETLLTINSIGYPLYNGFGMTEAGITCVETAVDMQTRLKGYIGKPFNSCQFKIGENDELFIKGTSMHTSQFINYTKQERNINEWFPTGDKVIEEHGKYKIVGRVKELIIGASGENINPNILELKFENLPNVRHYCIIGVNKKETEEVTLVVELVKNINETEKKQLMNAIEEINAQLQMYERVTSTYVISANENLFGINKIPRIKIKKLFKDNPAMFQKLDRFNMKNNRTIPDDLRQLADEIKQLVANILAIQVEDIYDDSDFINDLGGDSFCYVSLLLAVEEKYCIKINDDYYTKCTNLYDLVNLINQAILEKEINA